MVLTVLVHEKDGFGRMCVACQSINNLLIHEEVRFNIMQTAQQYEDQATEGYQRLVFDPGDWIWLHMSKERFLMQRRSKLRARVHSPSRIINKIGENAYRLKLLDDYDISPIFNVKDLSSYHGEELRVGLFSQLWGIDAGASTTNLGNSILIMENSDSGVVKPWRHQIYIYFQVF